MAHFETQRRRATESFGNRVEGFQSLSSIFTRSWVTHSAHLNLPHLLSVPSVALCFQCPCIGFSPAEENFGKYCGILDREVSAGGAKGYYSFGGRHRMTFSRAQHGAHRERVCPWDLSRDEFCGSVYFFAPIGNLKHRGTETQSLLEIGPKVFSPGYLLSLGHG
jgi:hypothetical protein